MREPVLLADNASPKQCLAHETDRLICVGFENNRGWALQTGGKQCGMCVKMPLGVHREIAVIASVVFLIDRITKLLVMNLLAYADQYVVLDGFFKFVHWGNTGAAWSMFYGNNGVLALISVLALIVLGLGARNFDMRPFMARFAFGLIIGGILGNLTDRIRYGHVVDFIRFYLYQRGGDEIGFPAFNIADAAICSGVFLLLVLGRRHTAPTSPTARTCD